MSLIIAIEGADGVGKNTAAKNVAKALNDGGSSAVVLSFPRYRDTFGGSALGEFLSGRSQMPITPASLAVLYALDRFESIDVIRDAVSRHDVVLFDRYIGSNIAYQGAKVDASDRLRLMRWIAALETQTFTLPIPDLNIYLDTPLEFARKLMLLKGNRIYTERSFDQHEADLPLQQEVRSAYEQLAQGRLVGPWKVIRTVKEGKLADAISVSSDIVQLVDQLLPTSATRVARIAARA
jgi:dTMP kinase